MDMDGRLIEGITRFNFSITIPRWWCNPRRCTLFLRTRRTCIIHKLQKRLHAFTIFTAILRRVPLHAIQNLISNNDGGDRTESISVTNLHYKSKSLFKGIFATAWLKRKQSNLNQVDTFVPMSWRCRGSPPDTRTKEEKEEKKRTNTHSFRLGRTRAQSKMSKPAWNSSSTFIYIGLGATCVDTKSYKVEWS